MYHMYDLYEDVCYNTVRRLPIDTALLVYETSAVKLQCVLISVYLNFTFCTMALS